LKIWEPKPPGILWGTPGLLGDADFYWVATSFDPRNKIFAKCVPFAIENIDRYDCNTSSDALCKDYRSVCLDFLPAESFKNSRY